MDASTFAVTNGLRSGTTITPVTSLSLRVTPAMYVARVRHSSTLPESSHGVDPSAV